MSRKAGVRTSALAAVLAIVLTLAATAVPCGSVIRCDFVGPKHWNGNKYSYVAPFNYPGYWAVTPGKYYWQAHYYTRGDTAVYWSGIGSFVVK